MSAVRVSVPNHSGQKDGHLQPELLSRGWSLALHELVQQRKIDTSPHAGHLRPNGPSLSLSKVWLGSIKPCLEPAPLWEYRSG